MHFLILRKIHLYLAILFSLQINKRILNGECGDPTSCSKYFHLCTPGFSPHSRCFRAAESWNHQSGKEPTHHCPRLAGNCVKRLRQIFFLSSPTPSWRASRVQVRLRIRGRQRKWRKPSMAALFISRQTLRIEMNTRRAICERMALVQQSSLSPCIVRGGAGNIGGQTALNEYGRAAQTKRPVHRLQTHPCASSSVSELHGET